MSIKNHTVHHKQRLPASIQRIISSNKHVRPLGGITRTKQHTQISTKFFCHFIFNGQRRICRKIPDTALIRHPHFIGITIGKMFRIHPHYQFFSFSGQMYPGQSISRSTHQQLIGIQRHFYFKGTLFVGNGTEPVVSGHLYDAALYRPARGCIDQCPLINHRGYLIHFPLHYNLKRISFSSCGR